MEKALRKDLAAIARYVPEKSRVLDIGCGEGMLLEHLVQYKQVDGRGIELSQEGVNLCLRKGIMCVQGDADRDLIHYPDACFDYVISSQTLQATQNPKYVLSEMLRIAKHVIVSVPNFGYWYNRWYLFMHGRMPVSETLSYEWYETPNIHFCTLDDFVVLCEELHCVIEQRAFISQTHGAFIERAQSVWPNMLSEQGVFVLRQK